MYINGKKRIEKFSINGHVLSHESTVAHSLSDGCSGCAYSPNEQALYMAGHAYTIYANRTSKLTADGTVTAQPQLPTLGNSVGWSDPFSFILDGRQYVGGLDSNEVYSRALSMDSWVREVNLPGSMRLTARSGVVSQGIVYITGGDLDGSVSNATWSWSPGQAAWHKLPSMPHRTYTHCNVMVNSDIFVLGGRTVGIIRGILGYDPSRYVDVYNLQTQTWTQRSLSPYDMIIPSCAAAGTHIYIHSKGKVFLYDTVEDSWSVAYTMDTDMSYRTAMLIV